MDTSIVNPNDTQYVHFFYNPLKKNHVSTVVDFPTKHQILNTAQFLLMILKVPSPHTTFQQNSSRLQHGQSSFFLSKQHNNFDVFYSPKLICHLDVILSLARLSTIQTTRTGSLPNPLFVYNLSRCAIVSRCINKPCILNDRVIPLFSNIYLHFLVKQWDQYYNFAIMIMWQYVPPWCMYYLHGLTDQK